MDESNTTVTCSVVSDSLQSRWTVACQAPLSTGFSRQEYWSGLLFPPPGHHPNSGMEPALQADSSLLEPSREHRELYSAFRGNLNEVTVLSCFEVASSKQPPPQELLLLHVKDPGSLCLTTWIGLRDAPASLHELSTGFNHSRLGITSPQTITASGCLG